MYLHMTRPIILFAGFQNQNITDVENQSSMFPLGKWNCFNLKYKLIKKSVCKLA